MDEDHPERPSFLKMITIVAITVAIIILVFFALGYGFGRIFL
jgi:preprotein translocase subunit SecE